MRPIDDSVHGKKGSIVGVANADSITFGRPLRHVDTERQKYPSLFDVAAVCSQPPPRMS